MSSPAALQFCFSLLLDTSDCANMYLLFVLFVLLFAFLLVSFVNFYFYLWIAVVIF